MGAVAIGWGVATAAAFFFTQMGPSKVAKGFAAYAVFSWVVSNTAFLTQPYDATVQIFAWIDCIGAGLVLVALFQTPCRWLALLLAGIGAQAILELIYALTQLRDAPGVYFLANNVLLGVQLVAISLPTILPRPRPSSVRIRQRPPVRTPLLRLVD